MRVETLSLWRLANFPRRWRTLCRASCVSNRSRCGAMRISTSPGEPSAGIVRVKALSWWRRADLNVARGALCGYRACRTALVVASCEFQRRRRTLCWHRACQIALVVAPCKFERSRTNLQQVNPQCGLRTLSLFCPGACAVAWSVLRTRLGLGDPCTVFRAPRMPISNLYNTPM